MAAYPDMEQCPAAALACHTAEATRPTAQPEDSPCNTSSVSPSTVNARWPRPRAPFAAAEPAPVLMGAGARSSRRRGSTRSAWARSSFAPLELAPLRRREALLKGLSCTARSASGYGWPRARSPPAAQFLSTFTRTMVTLSIAPRSSAISSRRLPASAEDVPIKERSISGADIIL